MEVLIKKPSPVLLRIILFERRFLVFRITMFILASSSFITFAYDSVTFSCSLSIFQNVLGTFLATYFLLSEINRSGKYIAGRKAAVTGALIGSIPASILILISNLKYYCLGGMEAGFAARNLPLPELSSSTILLGLYSDAIIFVALILISAIIGLFVGALTVRD